MVKFIASFFFGFFLLNFDFSSIFCHSSLLGRTMWIVQLRLEEIVVMHAIMQAFVLLGQRYCLLVDVPIEAVYAR